MPEITFTHDQLCDLAVKWIRATGQCRFVDKEIHAPIGQVPDAIGLGFNRSIMVECKTSRADFFADKKKNNYGSTTGKYRFYLCPPNIIKPDDLDKGYGLLYAHGKKVKDIEPIVGARHGMCPTYNADRKPKLSISIYKEAVNPNVNEWAEYQICLKAMMEHKIRHMPTKEDEKYNRAAFQNLRAMHNWSEKKLKEKIDELEQTIININQGI